MHFRCMKFEDRVKTKFRMVNREIQSQLSYNQIIAPIGLNFISATQNDSVRLFAWQIVPWFQFWQIIISEKNMKYLNCHIFYLFFYSYISHASSDCPDLYKIVTLIRIKTNIYRVSHKKTPLSEIRSLLTNGCLFCDTLYMYNV